MKVCERIYLSYHPSRLLESLSSIKAERRQTVAGRLNWSKTETTGGEWRIGLSAMGFYV